jgi:hypothetical protein
MAAEKRSERGPITTIDGDLHYFRPTRNVVRVWNPCCHSGPAALLTEPLRGNAAQERIS